MLRTSVTLSLLAAMSTFVGAQAPNRDVLLNPDHPEMSKPAPAVSRILLDTSKGRIVLEMTRAWSPHGADRFYNLVRHGYYDEARFFRIRAATWAQFGIAADPRIATAWRNRTIPDDPRVVTQRPRDGRLCVQGSEWPHDAGLHQPERQRRDPRRRAIRSFRQSHRGDGRRRRAICGLRRKGGRRHPRREAGSDLC